LTIRESLVFKYKEYLSSDFDIINVSIDGEGGWNEENFLPISEIHDIKTRGRHKPWFQYKEQEPLIIPVSFAFKKTFDKDLMRWIVWWLDSNYYQRLIFSSAPHRVFYAMPAEESFIIHDGLQRGIVNLNFRCNAPYSFGNVYESVHTVENEKIVHINNFGDREIPFDMAIEKNEDIHGEDYEGEITITNLSNGGETSSFTEKESSFIDEGSKIYIDNEFEEIVGKDPYGDQTYFYEYHNDNFLRLLPGENKMRLRGFFDVRFRWQPITLQ